MTFFQPVFHILNWSEQFKTLMSNARFHFLSISEDQELKPIFFGQLLPMYLGKVLGNLPIILAISSDSHLHTLLNFFLSNLSLGDTSFISTSVPKKTVNIQNQSSFLLYHLPNIKVSLSVFLN